jgi:hypothetical protein
MYNTQVMAEKERIITFITPNRCPHADSCGLVNFLIQRGEGQHRNNQIEVNCQKTKIEECSRNPDNELAWVELNALPRTADELTTVFGDRRRNS